MEIVIGVWGILMGVVFVQVYFIIRHIRKTGSVQYDHTYSKETLEKTQAVVEAIETGKIKKHIVTNSAPVYDSPKTLMQFRTFMASELMQDILEMGEVMYSG